MNMTVDICSDEMHHKMTLDINSVGRHTIKPPRYKDLVDTTLYIDSVGISTGH